MAVEGDIFYMINNVYISEVYGLWFTSVTSIKQTACLLPFFGMLLFSTPFVAFYSTKYKDIKNPIIVGFVLCLVGVIGLGTGNATSGTRGLVFNGFLGIGFSALLMLIMTVVQFSSPPLYIGVASALAISARTMGGTVGYAIATVIWKNVHVSKASSYIFKAVTPLGFDSANLDALVSGILNGNTTGVPGATTAIVAAASSANSEALAYGYGRAWYAQIPAIAIAIAGIIFVSNPAKKMDYVIDAPLEDLGLKDVEHKSAMVEDPEDKAVF